MSAPVVPVAEPTVWSLSPALGVMGPNSPCQLIRKCYWTVEDARAYTAQAVAQALKLERAEQDAAVRLITERALKAEAQVSVPVAASGDPLAVLTLGGIDGDEFDSWDLEVFSGNAIEKLQQQLVRTGEPVILNLYAAELAAPPPQAQAAGELPPLPGWIDSHKGKDPLIDDLISYIETQHRTLLGFSGVAKNATDTADEFMRQRDVALAARQPAPVAATAAVPQDEEKQPMIGRLMDEISILPVLWGLDEPGALLRNSDVFRVLVNVGKEYRAGAGDTRPSPAQGDALKQQAASGYEPGIAAAAFKKGRAAGIEEADQAVRAAIYAIENDGLLAEASGAQSARDAVRALKKEG